MIPLEQGSVFRRAEDLDHSRPQTSQSLWNRAVSFDGLTVAWNGEAFRVSIPLEQGSVFRRERY